MRDADGQAPELERTEVLRDPARVEEAQGLLAAVLARTRPLPQPPAGPGLDELALPPSHLAVRAGQAVADGTGDRYVPFFLHGGQAEVARQVLAAVAREIAARQKGLALAWLSGGDFAAELVDALGRNDVDAWRIRLRRVGVLVMPDVDALAGTERAQEELFHLFDDLRRRGARLLFSAADPPSAIAGLEARLRGRLESGLVLELPSADAPSEPASADAASGGAAAPVGGGQHVAREAGVLMGQGGGLDRWFTSAEKALWRWPGVEDVSLEEGQ
jgi:hypothetical protein